jgi:hypothetical protein
VNLINYPFVRMLWFPMKEDKFDLLRVEKRMVNKTSGLEQFTTTLNQSQKEVVKAMVSNRPRLVIIHGKFILDLWSF